jgi:AbrB family looped-hinge helix DNA binding protein
MKKTSRLSSKGQVTIPAEVRAALRLSPGDLVAYEVRGEKVLLKRAEPFDAAFHLAVSETLEEWGSSDDDKAFRDL